MFVYFNQESNVDTNVPSSGTHDPNDSGVPLATGVQVGTGGISCVIQNL